MSDALGRLSLSPPCGSADLNLSACWALNQVQLKRRPTAESAVSVGKVVAMTTVYAAGSTNDELIAGLHNPDPNERARNAEAIGVFHMYLALPNLLDVARRDPEHSVRDAARRAVIVLMPSEEAADRALAGDAPFGAPDAHTSQKEQAAAVIALFKAHVAARTASFTALSRDHHPQKAALVQGPKESDLVSPVIAYLGAWSGHGAEGLDEVELAATAAIGSIARFLEIQPQEAGCKFMSFRDAKTRIAAYEAALAEHAPHDGGEPA